MITGTALADRYLTRHPVSTARLRLLCFHHAGGAASAFADWQEPLGRSVAVLPVQLPGRESRINEPRFRDMNDLVAELDERLDPWLDEPHVFYGHSMGAAIAYALTARRMRRGRSVPRRLIVGAYPAPHLRTALSVVHGMTDEALADWMIDIGGMSPALRKYPDWLRTAARLTRDDLSICSSSWYRDGDVLSCPVDVFTGAADPIMSMADAIAWEQHTSRPCTVHLVNGGHFFTHDSKRTFLATLRRVLATVSAPPFSASL